MPRPLALVALTALFVTAPAAAHVTVTPHFIVAGDKENLSFTLPNELDKPMTGFSVVVRSDLQIVTARSDETWRADVQGERVTWRGGSLAPGDEASFTLELEAPTEPGPANLEAEQLYPGLGVVPWAVGLTVTPASEAPSQNLGLAAVIALVGLLVLSGVGIALFNRTRSLQEK